MAEEITFQSAVALAAALRARQLSAREVVEAHLTQIDRVNPQVNAIVTIVAEQAIMAADRADDLLVSGGEIGPLHGLPIVHKDTHATAGIRTTQGSPIFADFVPAADELIVRRELAAGAITLGKTNVPEFAAGSHTFNPVFGMTRNPFDVTRSAGGSSGGAAAALATGMAPLADGSDMGGSLRNPAAFCNVVGLRPSPGRVPSWPTVSAWSTLSVQGPMARSVADVALLLSAIAGPTELSPIALDEPGYHFGGPLDRDMAGLRVAWSADLGGAVDVDPEVRYIVAAQAAVFADLGCVVEEGCIDFDGADEVFRNLRAIQFEAALGPLRDAHSDLMKPSIIWNIDEGRKLTGADLARTQQLQTRLYHRVRQFFEQYDVLVLPTSQVAPFDAGLEYPSSVDNKPQHTYIDWMRSCYFVSAVGCPALSVPAGFTSAGLPVGIQIVGPHRADLLVLQVGHAFEEATRWTHRRPPIVDGCP
ncbi:MAG: amidase [Frankiales bacterium]|nr:amidase [Frankiales bacterium]